MANTRDKFTLISFLRLRHDTVHRGKPRLGSMSPDGALVYLEFDLSPVPSAVWTETLAAAAQNTVMEGRVVIRASKLTVETTEEELESDVKRVDGLLDATNAKFAAQIAQAETELAELRQAEAKDVNAKDRLQARLRKMH